MRVQVAPIAVAFVMALRVLSAEAAVIDDFNVGPLVILGANETVQQTQSGLDPIHVMGGSRQISYRSFSTPPTTLTIDDVAGTLNVSPGNCCTYLTLAYGSVSDPLETDLTADGSDRFVVSFAEITADIPFSVPAITARDDQNRLITIVNASSLAVQPTGPFSVAVPFSQFPNFNFANVQSIQIDVSRYGGGAGGAGKSFTLDSITTVPEPASLTLFALLVLPLSRFRCRRGNRLATGVELAVGGA